MMRYSVFLLLLLVLLSCDAPQPVLRDGPWVAELEVKDGELLPFAFTVSTAEDGSKRMEIHNAEEVIQVDEIWVQGDSIVIRPPVFEGYLAGRFTKTGISGSFVKEGLDRVVPFQATYGRKHRFGSAQAPNTDVSGSWEADFSAGTLDAYKAKGIFEQQGEKVTGTFRTAKGDYRFLEGVVLGDTLRISAFDGAHAFLFTAAVSDSTMTGTFYSGNHFKEPFVAKRNEGFELPDAETLTYLKGGYETLEFAFPDEKGHAVSLNDARFKDKVVIVQLMGTWCPNCLDESKFIAQYLRENPHPDLAVVALAFEYVKTPEKAFQNIKRLRERLHLEYPILLAQYGTTDKAEAQKKLPMLNHVLSYPTTLFVDRNGKVRRIHTGFDGPATGEKYKAFISDFDGFVKKLLQEE
ncbi:MAG: TlpA disulfide reductase family protein [Flavobacteriaceae bacterium]